MKKYSTIGCCGIDCGLCPRFYTKGESACPGCDGLDFKLKHPSCGFLTCCVIKHGFEVCSDCQDFPCSRFDSERKGFDSFVTHKRIFLNLDSIKNDGIDSFIYQQRIRMTILADFLTNFDDGRSKNFFCLSCALFPLKKLQEEWEYLNNINDQLNIKERNKILKERLLKIANDLGIELRLNNKK